MPLKIAANLNWLFTEEHDFMSRYALAKAAGFSAVECADPYDKPLQQIVKAREQSGISHILINSYKGSSTEAGIAALPGREEEFRKSIEKSIDYCKALKCERVHLMSGRRPEDVPEDVLRRTLVSNLKYAAEKLAVHNLTALIEPINTSLSLPGYYLDSIYKAADIIKEVNEPNLKLQFDMYHIQVLHGNLTMNLKEFLPILGHVQISQVPSRNEPDTPGEIDYNYIFKLLNDIGYEGYIGLEYKPLNGTTEGLGWIQNLS